MELWHYNCSLFYDFLAHYWWGHLLYHIGTGVLGLVCGVGILFAVNAGRKIGKD